MSDSRDKGGGPLALARRLLGRVIETVRGSEHPAELVPADDARRHVSPPRAPQTREAATPERAVPVPADPPHDARLEAPTDATDSSDERVVELPAVGLGPALDDPATALLADASWSGLRAEDRGEVSLLAWRDCDPSADTLRIVEVRCDFGALDAEPRITVTDRPASGVIGASTLASDAARVVVALGTMRMGEFVSAAHAELR